MMSRSRNCSPLRLISASIIGLVVIGGGAWLLMAVYLKPAPEKVAVSAQAKAKVKTINLQGDQTLQGQYLTLVADKQPDQAQKLFNNAVAAETDMDKKRDLLSLNVSLALQTNQIDQALMVAQRMVSMRADVVSYSTVAQIYGAKRDLAKQKEYLTKALAVARLSTDANKDSNIAGLTAQINGVTAMEKMQQ